MKEIELTQGYVALVDDKDFDHLSQFSWRADIQKRTVYAKTAVPNKGGGPRQRTIRMHEAILNVKHADHRDGNGLNNTRANLRVASRTQNQCNRGAMRNNKLGIKGVSFVKARGKFQAMITVKYKDYHLGYFSTPEEAHAAYCKAAVKLHKEFARTK